MKQNILIASLARVKKSAPWRVGFYEEGSYSYFTVGNSGSVAMSPKFHSFLKEVEKKVSRYPVDISFHSISKNREMEISRIRNQIVYADGGFEMNRLIPDARFHYSNTIMASPLEIGKRHVAAIDETGDENAFSSFAVEPGEGGGGVADGESFASTTLDYVAVGEVTDVADADTITVTLKYVSDFMEKHLSVDDSIKIRYNGVDAPEKAEAGQEEYKDPKNTKFAKEYAVTKEVMYEVAEEGYEFNKKQLGFKSATGSKPLVVIHFNRNENGKEPLLDSYGRYISDVYSTYERTTSVLVGKIESGISFTHVGKSLLINYSTKHPRIPLGFFDIHYAKKDETVLGVFDWISELGIKTFDSGGLVSGIPSAEADPDAETLAPSDQQATGDINTDKIPFDTSSGPKENAIDFFEPYDDRLLQFTKGLKTTDDLKTHSKIRIGDVILTIPPISIEVNKISNISKVKTMRTKSSVLVNRGQTMTTLTMNLYFHDLESINGKAYPMKEGDDDKPLRVDGLRPLLAQFAKAPFLPIDNYYVNDTLGIHDVALLDIEVSTVPNFPESLTARLTLVEFNSEAYFMDTSHMGDAINYPMLRWYYNQSLVDRGGEKYRHFKALDGPVKSDIKFKLADSEYLMQRDRALSYIKTADSPETVRVQLETKNESYQTKMTDANKAKTVMRQYNRYKEMDIKNHTVIVSGFNPPYGYRADALVENLIKTYKLNEETARDTFIIGQELYLNLYDNEFMDQSYDLKDENLIFIPYEAEPFENMRFNLGHNDNWAFSYADTLPVDYSKAPYVGKEKQGFFILPTLEDVENQSKLEKMFSDCYDGERFIIPATSGAIDVIDQVATAPEKMQKSVDKYEEEFNAMMAILDSSEMGVPMKDYEIPGGIIPLSLNARFSNEFSMAHVQAGEAVTLQYMGGGDPAFDMVLEVNEEGAKAFNKLISLSDYYAKTFNQGITNGYLGIENDLAQLFGIRYVMFESIAINTVPNFPGRFQIMLRALSFDKTQRQREELTSLAMNRDHITQEDLANNRNAYANDRMIEARLRKLEIYPDMELPTFEMINAVLPKLDTGGCKEYLNYSDGLYLDPDFYISTKNTLRQIIDDEYDGIHQLNMFDATGVAAYSSNKLSEKLFDTTDENWEKLKKLEETEGVEPIGWVAKWTKNEEEAASEGQGITPAVIGEVSVSNPTLKEFLDKEVDGKPAYSKFPGAEEWTKMFDNNEYPYSHYKNNPGGDEVEIYKELNILIDKHFKDYYSEPDFIEECRGDLANAEKYKKQVSYGPVEEMYAAAFHRHYAKASRSGYIKIEAMITDDETLIMPKKGDNVKESSFKKTDEKPTKERIFTMMKAFLEAASEWSQYDKEDKPLVSGIGRVGIGQVDITGVDMTLDDAKKLMYNWKYNLQVAVRQLAQEYKQFTKLTEDYTNFEVYSRPWDAMFAAYDKPAAEIVRSKDVHDSPLASAVMKKFMRYATLPFNTMSGFKQEIYMEFAGLEPEEAGVLSGGSRAGNLTGLLAFEYYDIEVLEASNYSINSTPDNIAKTMEAHLEQMTDEQLQDLYVKHLKNLYMLGNDDNWVESTVDAIGGFFDKFVPGNSQDNTTDEFTDWVAQGKKDKNGYFYSYEKLERAKELYLMIKMMEDTAAASVHATDTRLLNDVDPRIIYEEMFYELRHFDQRGRMVRAFPGFQMFIIHEGSYFGKHKFWDNVYGFNAIKSIDVHRSRKIAADTAVISMVNVYSNLTTRRTDVDYVDRQMKWWDNYIWNNIPDDLLDKKANEVHKNLFLETGARISLRLGYGSNAGDLPIVFNGTITELQTGDVIEMVAQGDGLELGSMISGDPDDDNNGLFAVQEPRDLICSLMSSKGSWMKDFMNGVSEGRLARDNPLGIMHFGQPFDESDSTAAKPLGNLVWYNDEYGEVAQNIYSSNGTPTMSQWLHPNGERNNIFEDFKWSTLLTKPLHMFNPGDEKNVIIKFYNNTVWDIIQTVVYTSPDYIAAVHPFEMRSTLFFGKPYWRATFNYDSYYEYDIETKAWVRHLTAQPRRPYMQHRFYSSSSDIIQNNIRATEDNIFTNAIVSYDGNVTPVLFADQDIRYDKHKTRVIEADIIATFVDKMTSERMAGFFGASALRDSMKDMYQGELIVMGDPSVKPHDMMNISDTINDMTGPALVKAVTHHFSLETGFITSIQPDLLASNDDALMMEFGKWYASFGASIAATIAIRYAAKKAGRNLVSWTKKPDALPQKVSKWTSTKGLRDSLSLVNDNSPEMKKVMETLDEIVEKGDAVDNAIYQRLATELADADAAIPNGTGKFGDLKAASRKASLKSAAQIAQLLGKTGTAFKVGTKVTSVVKTAASFTPVGLIANVAIFIGSEMLFEHYRRMRENSQTVIAMPLTFRGKELTAGINGHGGMIYGDAPGRYDRMRDATLFHDDGDAEYFGNAYQEIINFFIGVNGDYSSKGTGEELTEMGKQ